MFAAAKRVIVIGDVHGDIVRLFTCLRAAHILNESNEWIAQPPDTFVVQMGDQIDSKSREPISDTTDWESVPDLALLSIMDELDDMAIRHGGRVLSLLGNHELMNLLGDFTYVSPYCMRMSGGAAARAEHIRTRCMDSLLKRFVILKIGKFLFCHAGILPQHLNLVGENINMLNDIFRDKLRGNPISPRNMHLLNDVVFAMSGLLWTREYMELASSPDTATTLTAYLSIVLRTTGCTTMFIGHNTQENTTIVANGSLIFTDACFSRAYGKSKFQYIDISQDSLTVVEVKEQELPKNDIRNYTYDSMI